MSFVLPEWFNNVGIFNEELYEYLRNGYRFFNLDKTILCTGKFEHGSSTFIHHVLYINDKFLKRKEVYITAQDTVRVFYQVGNFEYRDSLLTYQEDEREEYDIEYLSSMLSEIYGSSIDLINRIGYIVNDKNRHDVLEYNVRLYNRLYSNNRHGNDMVYKNGKYFCDITRDVVFLDGLIKEKNKQM